MSTTKILVTAGHGPNPNNNTVVCYKNKGGGGTRSRGLTNTAKVIADWCESRNNFTEAIYLGAQNVLADEQSRTGTDASDWRLSHLVLRNIIPFGPSG